VTGDDERHRGGGPGGLSGGARAPGEATTAVEAVGEATTTVEAVDKAATAVDEARRRGLRRMKRLALALLVLAAAVYVLTRGATGALGFVNAAAEASMVGAVADWFAVTALFTRPLGLPIPHTALIPTRKQEMGRTLQRFVAENFLASDAVTGRIVNAEPARRVGAWLSDSDHAARVAEEVASAVRGAMTVMRDEQVVEIMEAVVLDQLLHRPWGPPAGRLLDRVVTENAHHRLVDVTIEALHRWVLANEDLIVGFVSSRAPAWMPPWVDQRIGHRAFTELRDLVADVRRDPGHQARATLDELLLGLAVDLRTDPDTMRRADAVRDGVLGHPDVRAAVDNLWITVRKTLQEAIDDPRSELRQRLVDGLASLGHRLSGDERLRRTVDGYASDAAGHLISGYRHEVATVISETVDRWDADDASRRIELAVGRDLQFIRINGTVVGGLAGVLIHAASVLAG
jgi:uncharacterized membrane-anchored protein YjiN (DUF445 family)